MSQMLKSSGAMGAATLTSRVLGMVREMAYARFMGDSRVAGAFLFAFMIPNLFRRLLGEGALTAAFIPVFKEKEKTAGEEETWRAANAVISGLVIVAAIISGLVMLGVSVVLWLPDLKAETRLMLELLRLMFPYMLLVCLAAVFMGVLNARGHFFVPALGAAVLNVVMIASVLFLAPRLGERLETQIFGLAIGVLVAGVAQAAFQLPTLRREGFRFRWVAPWRNETVQRILHRMLPGLIGVAALQINVVLTQGVAWLADPTIVASFNYAVRLMELPQGVFGASLATFLLPALSGMAAEKKYPEFRAFLKEGFSHLLYVNLIASVLLVVLAGPIVRLLFERGQFGPDATERATLALVCLAPGLVAFSLVNVLARGFYALGDTQTPMKISLFCLALNLLLAAGLVVPLKQGGLGLANTVTACLNAALLSRALRRKLAQLDWPGWRQTLAPVLTAAVLAGLLAWFVHHGWAAQFGSMRLPDRIGAVFVPAAVAGAAYLGATIWQRVPAALEILALIRSWLGRRRGGK